ncbi:hypothetical protein [Ferviditalea candida]|uniref:NUDIX hydrolase n=1 Tax=Ferviditalea candida TaxID=3108399 RepID=A0ABU5ZL40_9BACL|nr:hypothetical protein [Paenibacillaceae bacterium T2]
MIEVAAAIIENGQGQILIARRKKGKSQEGLCEFPGGKLPIVFWSLLDKYKMVILKPSNGFGGSRGHSSRFKGERQI